MKTYNITGTQVRLMLAVAAPLTIGKALGRIWDCQTANEKQSRSTEHTNGVGFSAFDAREGSYIAKWCRDQGKAPTGKYLVKASKLVQKYREQLAVIYGSNPDMFEADFGQHIAIAMRSTLRDLSAASLNREAVVSAPVVAAKRTSVTAKVTHIDEDGVIHEKVYNYEGTDDPADMVRALDRFAGRATKAFVAGKVLPAKLHEETSFANVG